jgi:sugar transferase (PEP-CTERM/EpsH1 system associated)
MSAPTPLIAHVLNRFAVGGLENGVVNLLNHIPSERYRHAIIAITDYSDEFCQRLNKRADIAIYALHKKPGRDPSMFGKLYRLLRSLNPAILHTRNLAALDALLPATLAGVKCRVHGEHGRDVEDLDGSSKKYQWLRRLHRPFVHRYIALSKDLERYLVERVGVAPRKISQIYNGVDTDKFKPAPRLALPAPNFGGSEAIVIGAVGRMKEVKDPLNLVRAFVELARSLPEQCHRLRLAYIGDGPLREQCARELQRAGMADQAWLPGERSDVAELMRAMDIFVLPSLAEGISNTILEAQASALPVVATRVGGNVEIVAEGLTGALVAPADPAALAVALSPYVLDEAKRRRAGEAARAHVVSQFSMDAMVSNYLRVYDALLYGASPAPVAATAERT